MAKSNMVTFSAILNIVDDLPRLNYPSYMHSYILPCELHQLNVHLAKNLSFAGAHRQTDRQTDRQTHRQTDTQMDRHMVK